MAWEEFKKILEDEQARLEQELSRVAKKSSKSGDWEVRAPELNPQTSDASEMADVFEELETQAGREADLEERLKRVSAALQRIQDGSYGICRAGGEKIDQERLRANPLAETCIKHSQAR